MSLLIPPAAARTGGEEEAGSDRAGTWELSSCVDDLLATAAEGTSGQDVEQLGRQGWVTVASNGPLFSQRDALPRCPSPAHDLGERGEATQG